MRKGKRDCKWTAGKALRSDLWPIGKPGAHSSYDPIEQSNSSLVSIGNRETL